MIADLVSKEEAEDKGDEDKGDEDAEDDDNEPSLKSSPPKEYFLFVCGEEERDQHQVFYHFAHNGVLG